MAKYDPEKEYLREQAAELQAELAKLKKDRRRVIHEDDESDWEKHERQMQDDDDDRDGRFSPDNSYPKKYDDFETQAIYEAERRMGA
jgi:hypothetical protein